MDEKGSIQPVSEGWQSETTDHCQGRDAIDQKRRTEFDPNADLKNAGMFTADYGSAGSLAGGAV